MRSPVLLAMVTILSGMLLVSFFVVLGMVDPNPGVSYEFVLLDHNVTCERCSCGYGDCDCYVCGDGSRYVSVNNVKKVKVKD